MNLGKLVFGKRPQTARLRLAEIRTPPSDAVWRYVRAKADQGAVRAHCAEADVSVETSGGKLNARGGEDMIVTHEDGARAVVRADIFQRTYAPLSDGLFRKRGDVTFRYFTLDHNVGVHTIEGVQEARPGDWIMQGVDGELWPVPRASALEKYDPV